MAARDKLKSRSLASPLRRSKVKRDNSEFPSSVVAQEQQWEQLNEDVLPDHLEGVRVHRDGQFNKEFDHEAFLGPNKNEFDSVSKTEGNGKLNLIFKLADKNGDKLLSLTELKKWIQAKIGEHFSHSHKQADLKFIEMDANDDGQVTWDEYVEHLHVPKGTYREVLLRVAEYHGPPADMTRSRSPEHLAVDDESRTEEDRIAALFIDHNLDSWEIADYNKDGTLTREEFLNFQHPEQNRNTLKLLVSEVMDSMDSNGDRLLTFQEYAGIKKAKDEWNDRDEESFKSREEEFQSMVDSNADGVVDEDELESHLDPKSEQHAYNEAMHLIAMADANNDQKLSLREILDQYDFFVGSPVMNASLSLHHDEF